MEIQADTKTVLSGPLKDPEKISDHNQLRVQSQLFLSLKTHVHEVLAKNGSPGHVSMAQNGIGTRRKFSPYPARRLL